MSDALGTDKIRARVHAKYGGFGWVVFDEFRDATGFASQCAADVVALGMYESRGFELHGVEIKTSRSDWLSDLNCPAKNDIISASVDQWWIAADRDVVKVEELPDGWGLYLPSAAGLKAHVRAKRRSIARAFPRPLVASLVQRVAKMERPGAEELKAEYTRGRDDGISYARSDRDYEITSTRKQLEERQSAIAAFESASGLSISAWNAGNIGAVVAQLLNSRFDSSLMNLHDRIEDAEQHARIAAESLARQLSAINEFVAKHQPQEVKL